MWTSYKTARLFSSSGVIKEKQGRINEGLAAYINALLLEPKYVPCKILISTLLTKMGEKMLPVARTLLSDSLRLEPTNYLAWYHLAMVHKAAGRLSDAMDCFQAASMLEESEPVESFSMIRWSSLMVRPCILWFFVNFQFIGHLLAIPYWSIT